MLRSARFSCDAETVALWGGCQQYLLRCVARRALLRDAMRVVSPELSKASLDRCQGFVDDLLGVVHGQRQQLAQVADTFSRLR